MQPPDICIYHGHCTDGFTAAWAVWKRFGDSVEYFPAKYGQNPPDVTGKHVLLVDFSYKRDVMLKMYHEAASVTVLDHHKTAQADLELLFESGQINGVFDMERSGAGIAWDYFHGAASRPSLINYVEDRDLWRWALVHSKYISSYLSSVPMGSFTEWDALAVAMESERLFVSFCDIGFAISRKQQLDCEGLMKNAQWIEIGGVVAPCVNATMQYSSDLANMLARIPEAPFGATWFETKEGDKVFSLRSLDEKMDVSEIALKYGGGGHRNASGFLLPMGEKLSHRYFIGTDDSSHHYLVPAHKRTEWDAWVDAISVDTSSLTDEEYEAIDFEPPAYARRIDGYHRITFSNPKEE